MSSGLPLEILGMIGPILCWVEGGERPGLPDSWLQNSYSFCERIRGWLIRELPTYSYDSLDEIVTLAMDPRNPCGFPLHRRRSGKQMIPMAPPSGFNLIYMLHKLSSHYFQWVGNTLCVREDRIVELHELALRFPVRHLIRYCHADAVVRGYISMECAKELPVHMGRLHTTYQGLRTVVERGLCEGHLHLNGVINADEAWADHLLKRSSPGVQDGFTPEADRLLVLSRTAVRLLAIGMLYAHTGIGCRKLLPFHLINHLDRMYQARNPMEDRNARRGLNKKFIEVFNTLKEKGQPQGRQEDLRWLLVLANPGMNRLWFGSHVRDGGKDSVEPRGVRRRLALLRRLHLEVLKFLVERNVRTAFIDPALEQCGAIGNTVKEKYKPIQEFMHQVATRYFIYHTHHWQKATQHGKTTGLRNFLRFFNAPQRESMGKDRVEMQGLAMEQLSQAVPLRAVEGRLAPPSRGRNKYLPWLLAFAKQAKEDKLDKFGIVVHFRKKDHEPFEKERTFTAVLNLRHGKIRRLTESDAFRLFRLLSTPDPVVPFIVGIDAANLELTTPPEVFAPAFRFLREYPIELRQRSTTRAVALEQYEDVASLVKKRRLGMTYHVGEDFRHLLSGLRAIDEVIEFLKPLPGDRLGHAIALALDPEVWAAQVGYQSVIPTQEWLDTLVWIHSLLGPGHDLIGQLSVEDRIQRYSRQIYGKIETDKIGKSRLDLTPPTLCDSWRLRQLDPYSVNTGRLETGKFSIRLQGYGNEHKRWADVQSKVLEEVDRYVGMESAYELVKYYWYDSYVRKMGDWCITVDMKAKRELWINVCREIQEKLQEKVRARQLVVEVNPSSNRVVGPMERMADHPVFRLTLDKQNHLARESRVTINTDDPGVFATSLAHEFYLLGESLLNRGVPEAEVEKWLDWLRKNGEDYSFLRSLPGAGDSRVENILNKLIKRNERLLRHLRGERRKYVPLESRIGSKWMGIRQTGDTDKSEQLEAAVKYLLEKIRTLEEERKAVR